MCVDECVLILTNIYFLNIQEYARTSYIGLIHFLNGGPKSMSSERFVAWVNIYIYMCV